jgi:cell division GTPase FtsZ
MKKIFIPNNDLLKIAQDIKDKFKNVKVFIHRQNEKIIVNLPNNLDRLKVEELKTFLKLEYPHYQFIFFFQ